MDESTQMEILYVYYWVFVLYHVWNMSLYKRQFYYYPNTSTRDLYNIMGWLEINVSSDLMVTFT